MSELTIRDMEQDEDFAAWFSEMLEQEENPAGWSSTLDERYLILSNEIGDWIGGLRFWLRGGVAHLVDVVVLPRSATGVTPTVFYPPLKSAQSSRARMWPSSGPMTPVPKGCWQLWDGGGSSRAMAISGSGPGH